MIRNYVKTYLKKNKLWFNFVSSIICLYLRFVYSTSKWQFVLPVGWDKKTFTDIESAIFAMWHDKLAFGPGIFKTNKKTAALVSPHSDGKLISSIILKFNFGIVEGSSNKNSGPALKQIIQKLTSGSNIVITPDGPRGPRHKIKGSTTALARKYASNLIPIACSCSKFVSLKSWDKLVMPLPFNKIVVLISEPVSLGDDNLNNDKLLEQILNNMNNEVLLQVQKL